MESEIELYGKQESIRYYTIDLLWGAETLYQKLRFVLMTQFNRRLNCVECFVCVLATLHFDASGIISITGRH